MCVGEWTYGGNVVLANGYMEVMCVLLNGHMEVLCVGEWIYGGIVCDGEWTYGSNVFWRMDIWRYCVCW